MNSLKIMSLAIALWSGGLVAQTFNGDRELVSEVHSFDFYGPHTPRTVYLDNVGQAAEVTEVSLELDHSNNFQLREWARVQSVLAIYEDVLTGRTFTEELVNKSLNNFPLDSKGRTLLKPQQSLLILGVDGVWTGRETLKVPSKIEIIADSWIKPLDPANENRFNADIVVSVKGISGRRPPTRPPADRFCTMPNGEKLARGESREIQIEDREVVESCPSGRGTITYLYRQFETFQCVRPPEMVSDFRQESRPYDQLGSCGPIARDCRYEDYERGRVTAPHNPNRVIEWVDPSNPYARRQSETRSCKWDKSQTFEVAPIKYKQVVCDDGELVRSGRPRFGQKMHRIGRNTCPGPRACVVNDVKRGKIKFKHGDFVKFVSKKNPRSEESVRCEWGGGGNGKLVYQIVTTATCHNGKLRDKDTKRGKLIKSTCPAPRSCRLKDGRTVGHNTVWTQPLPKNKWQTKPKKCKKGSTNGTKTIEQLFRTVRSFKCIDGDSKGRNLGTSTEGKPLETIGGHKCLDSKSVTVDHRTKAFGFKVKGKNVFKIRFASKASGEATATFEYTDGSKKKNVKLGNFSRENPLSVDVSQYTRKPVKKIYAKMSGLKKERGGTITFFFTK